MQAHMEISQLNQNMFKSYQLDFHIQINYSYD